MCTDNVTSNDTVTIDVATRIGNVGAGVATGVTAGVPGELCELDPVLSMLQPARLGHGEPGGTGVAAPLVAWADCHTSGGRKTPSARSMRHPIRAPPHPYAGAPMRRPIVLKSFYCDLKDPCI